MAGIVVCGFPGVGKSHLFRNCGDEKVTDSDSSTFDKADFPGNYIAHIKEKLADDYIVFCSTHDVVRQALAKEGIKYLLVYPNPLGKQEYMERYAQRGSPEPFLKLMDEKWYEFLRTCIDDQNAAAHIMLPPSTFVPSLGALRQIANNVISK